MIVFFFLLNIVSSCLALAKYSDFFAIVVLIALAALIAVIENYFYKILVHKWPRRLFLSTVVVAHSLILLVDSFLFWNFRLFLDIEVYDIIAATSRSEGIEFFKTYLSLIKFLFWLGFVSSLVILLFRSAVSLVGQKWLTRSIRLFSVFGVTSIFFSAYGYTTGRGGYCVPQMSGVTRVFYCFQVLRHNVQEIELLYHTSQHTQASIMQDTIANVVVVIGESYSCSHCQLYGYGLPNTPNMDVRQQMGELVVFRHVTSPFDATNQAMRALFSLDYRCFSEVPIFPVCFHNAGYRTLIMDNEYFRGAGINLMSNEILSDYSYDYRNLSSYQYDGEMITDTPHFDAPSLYVFHLKGQHYTYAERYPSSFTRFKANDYDSSLHTLAQRQILAHYDNATLYNDAVIEQIISRFQDTDCCLFYVSDHGEEIFDCGEYMGHGTSQSSPDSRYQLTVPLILWSSDLFRVKHADTWNRLISQTTDTLQSSILPTLLLETAGISYNIKY